MVKNKQTGIINHKKICIVDLDGILNYYPCCWVKFINIKTGLNFRDKEEAKKKLSFSKYKLLKDEYRKSDYKANLDVRKESLMLLNQLKNRGYFIVIATMRPFDDYPNLFDMTKKWLDKNNVPYDLLERKDFDSFKEKYQPDFFIEDEMEYANAIANLGYKVFLFKEKLDCGVENSNIIIVNSPKEILNLI